MSTLLYDVPGPRSRARNRSLSIGAAIVLLAILAWVIYRFWVTGQFEGRRWSQFEYVAIQRQLLDGLLNTLKAAAIASVAALAFGVIFASGRLSDRRAVRSPSAAVVELFRAVPLLILMFFLYYGPRQYGVQLDPMWAVVGGLTLYNGSVLAEVFRAGIAAVPGGQSEAGYAVGLRKSQVIRLILLPQAVRSMLPSIVSQLVVLLKDTALGFIVTYHEFLYVGKQMGSRQEFGFPYVPTYLVIAVVYIGLCATLSWVAGWLQRRNRRTGAVPAAAEGEAELDIETSRFDSDGRPSP